MIVLQSTSVETFQTETANTTLTLPGFGGDARCTPPGASGFFSCDLFRGGVLVTLEVDRTTGTTHYTDKPVSKATMITLSHTILSRL